MNKLLTLTLLCLAFVAGLLADAEAVAPLRQVPVTVKTPLRPGGAFTFQFSLHAATVGGTKVWTSARAPLTVAADGTIAYTLGAKPVFGPAVDLAQQLWLQVTGGGKTWRVPLGAAPYALWSASTAAGSITSVEIADGSVTAADIRDGAGSWLDADLVDARGRHTAVGPSSTLTARSKRP